MTRGPRSAHPIPRDAVNAERFYAKTMPLDGCLMWTGAKGAHGYGRFGVDGKVYYAHRVAWVLANGDIPPTMVLDHLCRRPACVAVAHLEVVTQATNILRSPLTPASLNLLKNTCPHGHPYTEFTRKTSTGPRQHRRCTTCQKEANATRAEAIRITGMTQRQYLKTYGSRLRVAQAIIDAAARKSEAS